MVKQNRGEHMLPMPHKGGVKMPLEEAMREVHTNIPENVKKTGKKGKAKEKMLQAIAFSKAGKSKK